MNLYHESGGTGGLARGLCSPALLAALAVAWPARFAQTLRAARAGARQECSSGQLTVDGDYIPGFMPAMTMPYPVKDLQGLEQVEPGDRITADVVVETKDSYWLEHIAISDKSGRGSFAATAPHELLPGETVPDVSLVNQDGKTIHLNQFKGKAVLLTFIYTRCPLPTFCPLISSEFAAIHKDLAGTPVEYQKTHLVSISLDPAYDTASVLRKYGLAYLQDDAAGSGIGTSSLRALPTCGSWHRLLASNTTTRIIKSLTV